MFIFLKCASLYFVSSYQIQQESYVMYQQKAKIETPHMIFSRKSIQLLQTPELRSPYFKVGVP